MMMTEMGLHVISRELKSPAMSGKKSEKSGLK